MVLAESSEAASNPNVNEQIESLATELFSDSFGPGGAILGMEDEDVVATNLHELIIDPTNVLTTLVEDGKLLGFSIAVPVNKMDRGRQAEAGETAYIYYTGIQPELQGQALVGKVLGQMDRQLVEKGYKFIERHAVLTQDWADNLEKHYKDAIVAKEDGTWWDEVGPERFLRIDLSKMNPDSSTI